MAGTCRVESLGHGKSKCTTKLYSMVNLAQYLMILAPTLSFFRCICVTLQLFLTVSALGLLLACPSMLRFPLHLWCCVILDTDCWMIFYDNNADKKYIDRDELTSI